MYNFPVDLMTHINKFCADNGLEEHLLIPDTDHLRNNFGAKEVFEVTVVFTPKTVSRNYVAEAALVLPLVGGSFDHMLKDYTMDSHGFDELEKFTSLDGKTYVIKMMSIFKFVRLASKGELSTVMALVDDVHCSSNTGVGLKTSLRQLVCGMSPKLLCDNIASEVIMTAMMFFRRGILTPHSLRSVAFAQAYYVNLKKANYDVDEVSVTDDDIAKTSFYALASRISETYSEISDIRSLDPETMAYAQGVLQQAVEYVQKEQVAMSFPDKQLPIATFFRRFTDLIVKAIKVY